MTGPWITSPPRSARPRALRGRPLSSRPNPARATQGGTRARVRARAPTNFGDDGPHVSTPCECGRPHSRTTVEQASARANSTRNKRETSLHSPIAHLARASEISSQGIAHDRFFSIFFVLHPRNRPENRAIHPSITCSISLLQQECAIFAEISLVIKTIYVSQFNRILLYIANRANRPESTFYTCDVGRGTQYTFTTGLRPQLWGILTTDKI
jgi:hypothetical protein